MYPDVKTKALTSSEPLSMFISVAIIVVVVSALLSILAFAFIAIRIIRDAISNHTSSRPKVLFFRTQLGHYAGCLVLSNIFMSVAGLIDSRWLIHSGLTPGSVCLVQAVLMQVGVWGTCWFTVVHGVHTFISLMLCVRQVYWHSAVIIITIGWATAFIAALLPLKTDNMYGLVGISCGITNAYPNEMIFLGALPVILSTFLTTIVYSLTFIIWHRRQNTSNRRKMRAFSSAYRRGSNNPAEYHKLVNMVIWTTFWFPLAFVLLMSPFCIIRILVHARQAPPDLNVFADACASIMGFVNVGLLLNTLRVISHVSHAANRATETMTFGHDASKDFLTGPCSDSQSEVSSYEGSCQTYNATQPSHSHSSSCSSVDSNTGLISAEKKLYGSAQTKAAPLSMHIIPPAELGRQFDNAPGITPPVTHNERDGLSPPPVGGETGITRYKSQKQNVKYPLQPMADRPVTVDLSDLPIRPPPVTHKLTPPATRKSGVPVASSDITSQIPAAFLGPDKTDLSIHRVSTTSSYASTRTSSTCTDSDSDYSGELMQAYKVRLSSQPQHGEDEEVFRGSMMVPNPQRRSAWARRITMDTIWSQESEDMTEDEVQEGYWQLISELLGDLGVTMDDQADTPTTRLKRQSTFGPRDARPQTLRVQPRTRATSKSSVHFADMSGPKNKPPTMKYAPKQSVV